MPPTGGPYVRAWKARRVYADASKLPPPPTSATLWSDSGPRIRCAWLNATKRERRAWHRGEAQRAAGRERLIASLQRHCETRLRTMVPSSLCGDTSGLFDARGDGTGSGCLSFAPEA